MILGLIGAAIALCGGLLAMMLSKPKRAASDVWIAVWLAAHLVHFLALGAVQWASGTLAFSLAITAQLAVILFAPAQYLAIWAAITARLKTAYIRAAFSLGLVLLLSLAILAADIEVVSGALVVNAASAYLIVLPPLAIALTLIYPAHALVRLHRYRGAMKQRLSNLHASGLQWMQAWLISAILILIVSLIVFLVSSSITLPIPLHVALLLTAQLIQIAYVGYHGVTRAEVFRLSDARSDQVATARHMGEAQADFAQLEAHFAALNPHIAPDLKAARIADQLGWSPDRLTQALKLGGETNFHDFVNERRVETFKALALDPVNARISLLALGFDSGFGSKSALYSVFREKEGQSPARWRRAEASTND